MTRSTAILMIQGAIVLLVIIIIYPWSNMGDSLHSDGKNELVTGYVPCGHQLPTCQKEGQHSSGADTPRMIKHSLEILQHS